MNKSAAIPGLNREDVYRLELAVPPIQDQRRIAAILDAADAIRAMRIQALEWIEALPSSVFAEMFQAPRETKRLSGFVREFRYGTSNKSGASGFPVLRIPNVVGGSIDTAEIKTVEVTASELERLSLEDGDLLFVRTNGNPDNVGRCAVFTHAAVGGGGGARSIWVFASYLIRARLHDSLDPTFLSAFLRTPEGRKQLREASKTSAGQYNINIDGISGIEVPVAGLEEQAEFAERVSSINLQRAEFEKALSLDDALFASLQSRAFRGEL